MPSQLSDALIVKIGEHVSMGATGDIAAQAEGVNPSTFRKWLQVGRDTEGEDQTEHEVRCTRLVHQVARARARFEVETLADLNTAETGGKEARPDPRPRQWLLERTRRDRYGVKIEVIAKEQAASQLVRYLQSAISPEAFAEVVAALEGWG